MVILSDVIYPAGDTNEYMDKFYLPYQCYPRPIYGVAGNHDWYDGLNGFMFHFCGAEALPYVQRRPSSESRSARIANRLWRRASHPEREKLLAARNARPPWNGSSAKLPPQPGSYFAIDTRWVLVVVIDGGITGRVDREQAEWLIKVSSKPKPKILLTGNPLYVDGGPDRGSILPVTGENKRPLPGVSAQPAPFANRDELSVLDIVNHAPFNYVATIGGDVHNYQRYEVPREDEVTLQHFVNGGGGAYLSATHRFGMPDTHLASGKQELLPVTRYPRPSESIEYYSRAVMKNLPGFIGTTLAVASAGIVLATFVPNEGFVRRTFDHLGWLALLIAVLGLIALVPCITRQWRAPLTASATMLGLAVLVGAGSVFELSHRDTARMLLIAGGALILVVQLVCYLYDARRRGRSVIPRVLGFLGILLIPALPAALLAGEGWTDALTTVAVAVFLAALVVIWALPYLETPGWAARAWAYAGGLAVLLALPDLVVLKGGPLLVVLGLAWGAVGYLSYKLARRERGYRTTAIVITLVGYALAGVPVFFGDTWAQNSSAVLVVLLFGRPLAYVWRIGGLTAGLDPRNYERPFDPSHVELWIQNENDPQVSGPERRVYRFVANLPHEPTGGLLSNQFSEFFDLDEPSLYRSFVRVDVTKAGVTFTPLKVTGAAGETEAERIEEPIRVQFRASASRDGGVPVGAVETPTAPTTEP